MKLQKKYTALIAVIIILIFLFAFSYFSKFSFINFKPPTTSAGVEGPSSVETGSEENQPVIAAKKTFSFASVSCTASGDSDTVRFKIQAGDHTIGPGEMSVFLDNSGTAFKDSQDNKLNAIQLNANSVSDEFSFTAQGHKPLRIIMVSAPSGAFEHNVTCS